MSHHHSSRSKSRGQSNTSGINLGSLLGNIDLASILQKVDIGSVISVLSQLNSLKGNASSNSVFQNKNGLFKSSNKNRNNSTIVEENANPIPKSIDQDQITSILSKFNVSQESIDRIVDVLSNINLQNNKIDREETAEIVEDIKKEN